MNQEQLNEFYKRNPKKAKKAYILKENGAVFCDEHNEQAFCKKDDGTPICYLCVGIKKSEQLKYLYNKQIAMRDDLLLTLKQSVASGELTEMPNMEQPKSFSSKIKSINYGKKTK